MELNFDQRRMVFHSIDKMILFHPYQTISIPMYNKFGVMDRFDIRGLRIAENNLDYPSLSFETLQSPVCKDQEWLLIGSEYSGNQCCECFPLLIGCLMLMSGMLHACVSCFFGQVSPRLYAIESTSLAGAPGLCVTILKNSTLRQVYATLY